MSDALIKACSRFDTALHTAISEHQSLKNLSPATRDELTKAIHSLIDLINVEQPKQRLSIKDMMEDKGLSQRALAAMVGVSQAAVSGWINGATIRPENKLALATALGVRPSDLNVSESEIPNPKSEIN